MSKNLVRQNIPITLLAGLLVLTISHIHAADVSQTSIGFRSDGWSGVFPSDCKPPTEFNGVTGKNLRWKAPLPNHSNSSPIVVGKKAFVVCDGGWPEGSDCPVLVCIDTDTGKQLWQKPIDPYDNLPEAEAKEARADRATYWQEYRTINQLVWDWGHTTDESKKAALEEEMKLRFHPTGKARSMSIKELLELCYRVRAPDRGGLDTPDTTPMYTGLPKDPVLSARLAKRFFENPTWGWICMGITMPTPASDGQRVYVITGQRTATAFDLDGNKVWHVWHQDVKPIRSHWVELCGNSPFIVEGKLLMHLWDRLWCYDPATGKVLWDTPTKLIPAHSMGQPTVLHLPSAKGQTVTAIFCTSGQLIRLSDGKLLAEKIAWFGSNARMSGDGKDLVWSYNGAEAGGPPADRLHRDIKGVFSLRFKLTTDGERAETEVVWQNEEPAVKNHWGVYPIYAKGQILSDGGMRLDAATGKMLVPAAGSRIGGHGVILADNRLIGFHYNRNEDGMAVFSLPTTGTEAEKAKRNLVELSLKQQDLASITAEQRKKVIAVSGGLRWIGHENYGWRTPWNVPFAAGNCLYVRTFDYLYCFSEGK
ncbi:MAG: PQQ-binding-like beta-propeller repeat protein [bacterium]